MREWLKTWQKRWFCERLARKVRPVLIKRYGFHEYYSAEQVLHAASLAGVKAPRTLAYAVSMYVLPKEAASVLQKLKQEEMAEVMRISLISTCVHTYVDNSVAVSPDYNLFMHHASFTQDGPAASDHSPGHASDHGTHGHSCSGHSSCGGHH